MLDILKESKAMFEYAVRVRRHLHTYPEPTSREFNTVEFIMSELDKLGIYYENIPDGGVLGYIDGSLKGKTVLLRADCDALSMQESPYNARAPKVCVSKVDGVAHMCGHDSHVAMLLAAAKILNENKDKLHGRVILLFERGEEGGYCVYYILKYIQEKNIKIDSCWTNHIDTGLDVGQVDISDGPVSAGSFNYDITLTGKGGHGSRPDLSNNPIDCFAAILYGIKDLRMKYIHPGSPLTNTIGLVQSGTKRNVIPETLAFAGTCRFHDPKMGVIFKEKFLRVIEHNAELYDCKVEFNRFVGPSRSVINNAQCVAVGRAAVGVVLGADSIHVQDETSMGSDSSFATMSCYYPVVAAKVGGRNSEKGMTVGGHNPSFEFDEEGMPYGTAMYVAYAIAFLERKEKIDFTPYEGSIDDYITLINRPMPKRYDV